MDRRLLRPVVGGLIVLALSSCGGSSSSALPKSFESAGEGVAVRFPAGWSLTTRNLGYVGDPELCFDVSRVTARAIVDLRVVEYLPPYFNQKYLAHYPPRPKQFVLTAFKRGDEDWSPGKILSFREDRRVFYVGLVLPGRADAATRRSVVRILDSLTISPGGRCRPTSGVGSRGVPRP